MDLHIPTPSSPDPTRDSGCAHRPGCSCRRPYIGWALVIGVGLEVVLALATIVAGVPGVGLVACTVIGACTVVTVMAEIVAHYRWGLSPGSDPNIGRNRAGKHRPGQATWP